MFIDCSPLRRFTFEGFEGLEASFAEGSSDAHVHFRVYLSNVTLQVVTQASLAAAA